MQRIFDDVWRELERQNSPLTFPWSVEATRYTIARLVLEHVDDLHDPESVKREVLARITASGQPWPRNRRRRTSAKGGLRE